MSKDKLVIEFDLFFPLSVIDYLNTKSSVNLYSLSNLNLLLVIVWQKDKKRKLSWALISPKVLIYFSLISKSIFLVCVTITQLLVVTQVYVLVNFINMYLHKDIKKCAKFEVGKKMSK